MESARRVVTVEDGGAAGMIIDIPTEDAQDEQVPDSDLPEPKKPTKRKTRQQKVKALHVKQEVCRNAIGLKLITYFDCS